MKLLRSSYLAIMATLVILPAATQSQQLNCATVGCSSGSITLSSGFWSNCCQQTILGLPAGCAPGNMGCVVVDSVGSTGVPACEYGAGGGCPQKTETFYVDVTTYPCTITGTCTCSWSSGGSDESDYPLTIWVCSN